MKKLHKKFLKKENTVESYATVCVCRSDNCQCYCAPGTQWSNMQSTQYGNGAFHIRTL